MAAAAGTMKRVSLELGGNAPVLVFEDADLDHVVRSVTFSKFNNAGQACVAANRLYAAVAIADELADRLGQVADGLRLGPGTVEGTQIGPLIDESAVVRALQHVEEAVALGAKLVAGGHRPADSRLAAGSYFEPTVLLGVNPSSRVLREETFAPVLPISTFASETEAVEMANATPYGLAAYAYTRDLGRSLRLAEQLEFGAIGINDPLPFGPHLPFGGVKDSGIGKESGSEGIEEFLETRTISFGV